MKLKKKGFKKKAVKVLELRDNVVGVKPEALVEEVAVEKEEVKDTRSGEIRLKLCRDQDGLSCYVIAEHRGSEADEKTAESILLELKEIVKDRVRFV